MITRNTILFLLVLSLPASTLFAPSIGSGIHWRSLLTKEQGFAALGVAGLSALAMRVWDKHHFPAALALEKFKEEQVAKYQQEQMELSEKRERERQERERQTFLERVAQRKHEVTQINARYVTEIKLLPSENDFLFSSADKFQREINALGTLIKSRFNELPFNNYHRALENDLQRLHHYASDLGTENDCHYATTMDNLARLLKMYNVLFADVQRAEREHATQIESMEAERRHKREKEGLEIEAARTELRNKELIPKLIRTVDRLEPKVDATMNLTKSLFENFKNLKQLIIAGDKSIESRQEKAKAEIIKELNNTNNKQTIQPAVVYLPPATNPELAQTQPGYLQPQHDPHANASAPAVGT